jgi:hypothetical protein
MSAATPILKRKQTAFEEDVDFFHPSFPFLLSLVFVDKGHITASGTVGVPDSFSTLYSPFVQRYHIFSFSLLLHCICIDEL